jgi:hypothetical protein
MSEQEKQ